LQIEALETRNLLVAYVTTGLLPTYSEQEPNDTLDQATNLQDLTVTGGALVDAAIGNGAAGAADVDWYTFSLDQASRVQISSVGRTVNNPPDTVLSLYNNDVGDFNDLLDPIGHRLLQQAEADSFTGATSIDRPLAAGTYYVAVSGAGNRYFYPFLADSGLPGKTAQYILRINATDIIDPPDVLTVAASPQIIRLDLNVALPDFPSVTLTDANGQDVPLAWSNYTSIANELQLAPDQALLSGGYTVNVADASGNTVLTSLVQVPADPTSEAVAGAHDTAATAPNLGDITQAGLVQIPGTIGDDPYYDASSFDPALNPGNEVDMYHFQISGPGLHVVVAEVFAGRIGSPLDAGVSLYRLDPQTNLLDFVAGNNNSYNPTSATDFTTPLYTDPYVYAGFTAGDYYVAVSQGSNTPSPEEGQFPGPGSGIFDPNVSHSGQNGWNTGPYVLDLLSYAASAPPRLVSASIQEGSVLSAPPTQFTLDFTEPVNLDQLAFTAFQQTQQSAIPAVYIQSNDGLNYYYPRLDAYDHTANEASFQLLDALPNGNYQLHLSGSAGLANLAGQPLQGNDASGDYVINFTVDGPPRGANGNPLTWVHQAPDGVVQDLGVLFPNELQAGVTISRDFSVDPAATTDSEQDAYRFQILQDQSYILSVSGTNLDPNAPLTLLDSNGQPIFGAPAGDGQTFIFQLAAGSYEAIVGNTALDPAGSGGYQLSLGLLGTGDSAPPLLSGPAPAVSISLDAPSAPVDGEVPQIVLPDPPIANPNLVPAITVTQTLVSAAGVSSQLNPVSAPPDGEVARIVSPNLFTATADSIPGNAATLTSLSVSAVMPLTIVPLSFGSGQGTINTAPDSFLTLPGTASGFSFNNALSKGLTGLQDGLAGKLAGNGTSADVAWIDRVEIRLPPGYDTVKTSTLYPGNQLDQCYGSGTTTLVGGDDTGNRFDTSLVRALQAMRPRSIPLLYAGKDFLLARIRWQQAVSRSAGDEPLSWSKSGHEIDGLSFVPPMQVGRTIGATAESKRPSVFECLQAGLLTCAGMAGIATAWLESNRGRLQLRAERDDSVGGTEPKAGRTDGQ